MIIATNWKAYVESLEKAKKLVSVAKRLAGSTEHDFIIAPPTVFLGLLAEKNNSKLAFAVQDISTISGGAQTGEVTAGSAREAGATYAIVGHSERRARGETNSEISQKLERALAQGLSPILCVGERSRDDNGGYLSFLREEISSAFEPLSQKERIKILIAYEPVWAIGKTSSESITTADLTEMILYIRKALSEFLPGRGSLRTKILYGGSVEPDNIRVLAEGSGVDGFLIGHSAVEPDSFKALVGAVSV